MKNSQSKPQSQNDTQAKEIIEEIKKAQNWQTERYNIDRQLIEKGYAPAEIDAAWKTLEAIKPSRSSWFKRLVSSEKFWYGLFNRSLLILALLTFDFIPVLQLRLFSHEATLYIFVILVLTSFVALLLWLKAEREIYRKIFKAVLIWFVCLIPLGIVNFFNGDWILADVLVMENSRYQLLVQDAPFMMFDDTPVQVEIYKCQFVEFICFRVEERTIYNTSIIGATQYNRLILQMNKETGEFFVVTR